MRFDDGAANGKADAHALGPLAADEGLEQPLGNGLRDARSIVDDRNQRHRVAVGPDRNLKSRIGNICKSLDRVSRQVMDDLLDLHLVDNSHDRLLILIHGDLVRQNDGADQSEGGGLADQFAQVFGLPGDILVRDKGTDTSDDCR